jgi:hypothetical protein
MQIVNNQFSTENVEDRELESIKTQYWVDLKESLDKLMKNEDFKKVILDGYFTDKAVNGVSLLATDYVKQNGHRSDVMEQLIAISALQDYFETIRGLGTDAPADEDEE